MARRRRDADEESIPNRVQVALSYLYHADRVTRGEGEMDPRSLSKSEERTKESALRLLSDYIQGETDAMPPGIGGGDVIIMDRVTLALPADDDEDERATKIRIP